MSDQKDKKELYIDLSKMDPEKAEAFKREWLNFFNSGYKAEILTEEEVRYIKRDE